MSKVSRAALRYSALMCAYWDGTQEDLPGPVPVDLQEVRRYNETWQQRWFRLTGVMPDATDGERIKDHEQHEEAVRQQGR